MSSASLAVREWDDAPVEELSQVGIHFRNRARRGTGRRSYPPTPGGHACSARTAPVFGVARNAARATTSTSLSSRSAAGWSPSFDTGIDQSEERRAARSVMWPTVRTKPLSGPVPPGLPRWAHRPPSSALTGSYGPPRACLGWSGHMRRASAFAALRVRGARVHGVARGLRGGWGARAAHPPAGSPMGWECTAARGPRGGVGATGRFGT